MKRMSILTGTVLIGLTTAFPYVMATAGEQADQAVGRANTPQEGPAVSPTPQSTIPSQREGQSADNKPAAVTPMPVYKPPLGLGAPNGLVAGGSRGANICLATGPGKTNATLTLSVLAPADHVGLTVQEQPSLYWYLSATTTCQVEVTLTDEQTVEPLLELKLDPPTTPGLQRVRLIDHGVRLSPGVRYQWAVALVPDPNHRSKDIIAAGGIERTKTTEALQAKLGRANTMDVAAIYAEEGLWYDTVAAISDLITTAPQDSALRMQRAALLEQGHLPEVAAYDRRRDRQ